MSDDKNPLPYSSRVVSWFRNGVKDVDDRFIVDLFSITVSRTFMVKEPFLSRTSS
jgi:hypothetical protein